MRWNRAAGIALAVVAATTLAARGFADRSGDGRETIENAMPATVMVIAAEVVGGELVPIASGSGTVISGEGAVLTNHHVISDGERGQPHDLFVIARLEAKGRPPEMTCAGVPARGMLSPELDLALIQCEFDLDGLPMRPSGWPSLSVGESKHIGPGDRLWVLGYPDTGGMALRDVFGQVLGWAGEAGGPGETYIKADAAITHGNSGGAAIDQRGDLVGVPSAYRLRRDAAGDASIAVTSVGLIRPIHAARDLVDAARAGWRPHGRRSPAPDDSDDGDDEAAGDGGGRESEAGRDAPEPPDSGGAAPSGPVAPSASGVMLTSRVVSAHSGRPVAGAVVAVLEPGSDPRAGAPLADAIAWAETDASGVFRFDHPVSRRREYPVVVMAKGYAASVAVPGLELPADAPQLHDPWGTLELRPTRLR